jgi:NADH-quinone oxidoreductase subunit J
MSAELIIFYILAAIVGIGSILTVTTKSIMRAATYLFFVLLGTAGFYFLMGFTFLGAVQVMVYAGGIVVLYVFAILLTKGVRDKLSKRSLGKIIASLVATLAGAALLLFIILSHNFVNSVAGVSTADKMLAPSESLIPIDKIGSYMLSSGADGYLLPFEAVSVLLLASIVGGLIIARKR